MTRDDIIRMAREVFDVETDSRGRETFSGDNYGVERFFRAAYAAGAAAERDRLEPAFERLETLMKIREGQPNKPCCLAEREACAKVAETYTVASSMNGAPHIAMIFKECAAAIRARGNT